MRKIVNILLITLLVAGCSPQKRLSRLLEKYPIPPEITYTQGPVEYRDTIIYREVLGETVIETWDMDDLLATIEFPEAAPIKPIHAETDLASVDAWVDEGKLKIRLIQNDSLFQFYLDNAIRESRDTIRIDRVIPVEVLVIPKSYDFYKYGFFITLGILLLVIILMLIFLKMK